jgi:hypothetical protein
MWGATESCSEELIEAAKVTAAAPSTISAPTSTIRPGATAAQRAKAPKANAAPAIRRGEVRPWAPVIRTPATEPTAIAETRAA